MEAPLHPKKMHARKMTLLLLPFLAACLCGSARQASAQAAYAATHVQNFSVFAEGSRLSPDYGPQTNYGYTVGADYTRHYHILNPSIEGRITHAGGDTVGMTSYMGGFKGSKDYGHFHPYGDFLLGYGVITFTHPQGQYYRDNSTVFGAGGGVDYDIIGNFAAKAEFQFQSWKLGNANSRLTPTVLSIGVVYHLPIGH